MDFLLSMQFRIFKNGEKLFDFFYHTFFSFFSDEIFCFQSKEKIQKTVFLKFEFFSSTTCQKKHANSLIDHAEICFDETINLSNENSKRKGSFILEILEIG